MTDILLVLIWVQTVGKDFQQITKSSIFFYLAEEKATETREVKEDEKQGEKIVV